jgi:hypothetical protein
MDAPSADQFLGRFPEFNELLFEVVEEALSEAKRSTPERFWGIRRKEAVSQLTAHLLATRSMQIGIQVGSESGRPLGTGYDSTLYGQEYKRLLDTLPITGFVV